MSGWDTGRRSPRAGPGADGWGVDDPTPPGRRRRVSISRQNRSVPGSSRPGPRQRGGPLGGRRGHARPTQSRGGASGDLPSPRSDVGPVSGGRRDATRRRRPSTLRTDSGSNRATDVPDQAGRQVDLRSLTAFIERPTWNRWTGCRCWRPATVPGAATGGAATGRGRSVEGANGEPNREDRRRIGSYCSGHRTLPTCTPTVSHERPRRAARIASRGSWVRVPSSPPSGSERFVMVQSRWHRLPRGRRRLRPLRGTGGVHDHADSCEADERACDVVAIRSEAVEDHAPGE